MFPSLLLRDTALIEKGSIAPPVKMDGNTIVDGNHRMVAGLLCNQIPASTPGTAPLSKPRIPLRYTTRPYRLVVIKMISNDIQELLKNITKSLVKSKQRIRCLNF